MVLVIRNDTLPCYCKVSFYDLLRCVKTEGKAKRSDNFEQTLAVLDAQSK